MKQLRKIACVAALGAGLAGNACAEEMAAPAVIEAPVLGSATSSMGSTEILITVLATLLVWAAVQQNERAKNP